MNTDLRNKTKNDFKKDFFKLMNSVVNLCSTFNTRSK